MKCREGGMIEHSDIMVNMNVVCCLIEIYTEPINLKFSSTVTVLLNTTWCLLA
jgi:hypothetical protein